MSGSIKLFDVGGTAVRLHPTFFLLLLWIGAVYWIRGGLQQAIGGVIFIAILFVCVLLHEFGHVWVARRYGIRTPDVTLLPIGGVASMERMPEKPGQEIAVALAGPAVNLIIAFALILLLGGGIDPTDIARLEEPHASLMARVAAANLALCLFNLIPAFPMDGGRVLRALLNLRLGYRRATQVAAWIGQGLAIAFGFIGLFGNPLLILIAIFIFMAASAEAGQVQARDLARGYLASQAMITSFQTLSPSSTVDDGATLLLRTTQQEFPVTDGFGRLRGVLTREALITALKEKGGATPVLEIMTREIPTVSASACLETVVEALQRGPVGVIGVVDADQRLVGYVTSENIAEMITIRSSRQMRSSAQAP